MQGAIRLILRGEKRILRTSNVIRQRHSESRLFGTKNLANVRNFSFMTQILRFAQDDTQTYIYFIRRETLRL